MKKKHATRIITRGKYAYQCVGHFISKYEAEQYKNQTLHSLLIESDEPRVWGVGVIYHVYRRLG